VANLSGTSFFCHPERLQGSQTDSQSIGGTGIPPVQAQAKACGYKKLLFDCKLVSSTLNCKILRFAQNDNFSLTGVFQPPAGLNFFNNF
jgi:hypothetical protein